MTPKEAAEKYYGEHTELHEVSKEQAWLKDVVTACFQDGARWAYQDAGAIADKEAAKWETGIGKWTGEDISTKIHKRMSEGD